MFDFVDVSKDAHGNLVLKIPFSRKDDLAKEMREAELRGLRLDAALLVLQTRLAEVESVCLTASVPSSVPSVKVGGPRSPDQPTSLKRRTRRDRVPFGWRIAPADDRRLLPDRDEQTTIRRAQILHAAGESLREVCRRLDYENRPRRGKRWQGSHSVLAGILRRNKSI